MGWGAMIAAGLSQGSSQPSDGQRRKTVRDQTGVNLNDVASRDSDGDALEHGSKIAWVVTFTWTMSFLHRG